MLIMGKEGAPPQHEIKRNLLFITQPVTFFLFFLHYLVLLFPLLLCSRQLSIINGQQGDCGADSPYRCVGYWLIELIERYIMETCPSTHCPHWPSITRSRWFLVFFENNISISFDSANIQNSIDLSSELNQRLFRQNRTDEYTLSYFRPTWPTLYLKVDPQIFRLLGHGKYPSCIYPAKPCWVIIWIQLGHLLFF